MSAAPCLGCAVLARSGSLCLKHRLEHLNAVEVPRLEAEIRRLTAEVRRLRRPAPKGRKRGVA